MNKKIVKLSLLGLLGVNLFLFLSGIVIPWLVSTNQLPLAGIIFIVTAIIFLAVTIVCFLVNGKSK